MTFEEKINWSEVTDFVRYVRSPTNPILFMTDAADQKGFEDVFYKLIQNQTWDIRFLAITRGIVLGAISGKPDLLHNVRDVILNGSKEDLAARAQEFAERHMFFRAGQAHGGLAIQKPNKKNVREAVLEYCQEHELTLVTYVRKWHEANTLADRRDAARETLLKLSLVAKVFCAKAIRDALCMSRPGLGNKQR